MDAISLSGLLETFGNQRPPRDAARLDLDWASTRAFHPAKIDSLNGLEEFTSATEISLAQQRIQTLDGLPVLPHLRKLILAQNELASLEGATRCTHLEELDVSLNSIESLEGLRDLPQLRELHAEHNHIHSLGGLHLPALETLGLSGNATLTSLEGLGDLPNLRTLFVIGCRIIDWSPIGTHPSLKMLAATLLPHSLEQSLHSERLEQLLLRLKGGRTRLSLQRLPGLRQLEIQQAETAFSLAWEELPSLESIQLRKCKLEGMHGNALPKLEELELTQVSLDARLSWELFPSLQRVVLRDTALSVDEMKSLGIHCAKVEVIRR